MRAFLSLLSVEKRISKQFSAGGGRHVGFSRICLVNSDRNVRKTLILEFQIGWNDFIDIRKGIRAGED